MGDIEQAIGFLVLKGGSLSVDMPDPEAFRFVALMHGKAIGVDDKGMSFTLTFGIVNIRIVHTHVEPARLKVVR